jgi:hypothetical protein
MAKDKSKGPTGFSAIEEIARRLGDLAGSVEDALSKGEADSVRDIRIDTPAGPVTARMSTSMRTVSGQQRRPAETRPAPQPPPADSAPDIETDRTASIETFVDGSDLVVILDHPGAGMAGVRVQPTDGCLTVIIGDGPAHLVRNPAIRDGVEPAVRVANGIVEVRVPLPPQS